MNGAVFMDNFMIIWYYTLVFLGLIGFACIVEKVFEKFPTVVSLFARHFDLDLSDDDDKKLEVERFANRNW